MECFCPYEHDAGVLGRHDYLLQKVKMVRLPERLPEYTPFARLQLPFRLDERHELPFLEYGVHITRLDARAVVFDHFVGMNDV